MGTIIRVLWNKYSFRDYYYSIHRLKRNNHINIFTDTININNYTWLFKKCDPKSYMSLKNQSEIVDRGVPISPIAIYRLYFRPYFNNHESSILGSIKFCNCRVNNRINK